MNRVIVTNPFLTLRNDLLICAVSAGCTGCPPAQVAVRTADGRDAGAVRDVVDWCMDLRLEEMPTRPLRHDAQLKAAGCRSDKAFSVGASHVALTRSDARIHVNGSYNQGARGYAYSTDRQALLARDEHLPMHLLELLRDPSMSTGQPRAALLDAVLETGCVHVPKGRSKLNILMGFDDGGRPEWCGTWSQDNGYEDIQPGADLVDAVVRLRDEEASRGWTIWNAVSIELNPRRRTDRISAFVRWDKPEARSRAPWGPQTIPES